MKRAKADYPVNRTRRHLETGPIVLITSFWKGERNIMTLGWHTMTSWDQVATMISSGNHSHALVRGSRQCVINVPTVDLVDKVVGVGNSTGGDIDKFEKFGLTPQEASKVEAPLIAECYASFECQLADYSHGLFFWDVVKAHVAPSVKNPRTIHYRGEGAFMVAGETISRKAMFRPGMMDEG